VVAPRPAISHLFMEDRHYWDQIYQYREQCLKEKNAAEVLEVTITLTQAGESEVLTD